MSEPTGKIRCPKCGQKYRVPLTAVGRPMTCNRCQTEFPIPRPAADTVPAIPPQTGGSTKVYRPGAAVAAAAPLPRMPGGPRPGAVPAAAKTPTPPPSSAPRADRGSRRTGGRPPRRSGGLIALGAVALLLAAGVIAVLTWPKDEKPRPVAAPPPAEPVAAAPIPVAPPPASTPVVTAPPPEVVRIEAPIVAPAAIVAQVAPPPAPAAPPPPMPVVAVAPPPAVESGAVPFDPAWLKPRDAEPYLKLSEKTNKPTRFHNYTKKYFSVPDPAGIEAAGYLGGSGTEWLAGGGFQADGGVVVVGTCLGPELTLAGVAVTAVLGQDGPAPGQPKTATGKDGKMVCPDWTHEQGTGFAAILSPDLQQVKRLVRLPWKSGSVCAGLVLESGAVVLGGAVGTDVARLGAAADISAPGDTGARKAWVAMVDPGLTRIVWLRTFADVGKGLRLRQAGGRILAEGGWGYALNLDGTVAAVSKARKVNNYVRGVSPKDFRYALGYDRNTHTGREPWRQPHLEIYDANDQRLDEYYVWE